MTRRMRIALIAVVVLLLGISIYFLFFIPTEQVYNGVLIEQGLVEVSKLLAVA